MVTNDGHRAEQFALHFLQRKGLLKLANNFNCRRGEIDLIMQDKDTLVFVEVRYRKNSHYGSALESVTPQKQRRIGIAAAYFISQHKQHHRPCRFDVIAITGNQEQSIEWIKNAFQPELH